MDITGVVYENAASWISLVDTFIQEVYKTVEG